MIRTAWLLLVLLHPLSAAALDGVQCRDLLSYELSDEVGNPSWKFADPHYVSMYHATLYGGPVPNTAQGDLDADKAKDIAFLIEKTGQKRRLIAVCLSTKPKTVLLIEPGCSDSISLEPKGLYERDTISAGCAEITADTWLYENGKFKMIRGEGD